MFTGTYTCTLDNKGRFQIPKHFMEILDENAEEKGILFFTAADTLQVYTQKGIREVEDELQNFPELSKSERLLSLAHFNSSTETAFYSDSGMVIIPERFRKMYHLIPGTRLLIMGNDMNFEICMWEQE